jgi:hypothetical protein
MNNENRGELHSSTWERVDGRGPRTMRLKVPGGWLVTILGGFSPAATFYPDPEHEWNPPIKK